jgi:serine/threonine protein kinase/tetratricopeptide (TPR) repeat protein
VRTRESAESVVENFAEKSDSLEGKPGGIGPFAVGRKLGSGGGGIVFEATHGGTGEKVALKTVTAPSAWARASLRQEIAVLKSLDHPGIVRILDDGLAEGGVWYAMELLDGRSLADFHRELWRVWPGAVSTVGLSRGLVAGGRLDEVLRVYADLCVALDFVHARGLVHGDIKPENVFVRSNGQPVLVDFGLSRYAESVRSRLDAGVASLGTLCYAAPERLAGEHPDPRSDTYSLGCMLHESLTGTPPFEDSEPREILRRQLDDDPRPPSLHVEACPPELEALVLRMLSKKREARPHHLGEVAAILARLARASSDPDQADVVGENTAPAPRLHRPRLTGREDILRAFEQTRKRLDSGKGGLVFLGGESGIGKTFVLSEIVRRALLRRTRVVTGECPPLAVEKRDGDVAAPLRAFTSLLQATADFCAEKAAVALPIVGEWCGVLAAFEPSLRRFAQGDTGREPADLPLAAARARLFLALRACLLALSADRPLLVALDDLHWADELTLSFLSSLGPAFLDKHPIVIVGAYRAEEMPPALSRLVAGSGVTRLELAELRTAEIEMIVGDMLGEGVPPADVVGSVLEVSEGNPFFAAEYLRVLVADGAMYRRDGRWQASSEALQQRGVSCGATLEAVIARRLTSIPDEVVLQAGAVIGRTFDVVRLEALTELASSLLVQILDVARQRELIEQLSEGYRFLHDKVRQVAYESTEWGKRLELHRRAALASEKLPVEGSQYEHAARIAHHFRSAGILERALVYLERAAEAAIDSFAYREAIAFFEAALDVRNRLRLDEPVVEARLRRRIADAFHGLGEMAASEAHLVAAARRLGCPMPRGKVRLATGLARQVLVQVVHRLAPPLRRPVDARLEEAARVYDRLQQVNFFRGEGLPIFYCGMRTLNVAELVAPSAELATAYANAHAVAGVVPARRLGEGYLQKALDVLRVRPDPIVETYLLLLTGVYRVGCGQWGRAEEALGRASSLAEALGFARRTEEVAGVLAELAFLQGDLEAAIRHATEQLESGARGDAQTQCWGLLGRAQSRIVLKDAELALRDIERANAFLPSLGRPEEIWAYGLRARAALRAGDLGAATAAADHAATRIAESPPVAHYCLEAYVAVAEVRLAALSKERSRRARRRAEAACRAQGAAARIFPIALPRYLLHRGALRWLTGDSTGANRAFLQALERATALGMPHEMLLAHQVLASVAPKTDAVSARHEARAGELATRLGIGVVEPPVGWPG